MKLILVRHGEAGQASDDFSRELTETGIADVRRAGRLLAGTGWNFVRIITSPLVRTVQTGDLIQSELGGRPEKISDARLAPGINANATLNLLSTPGPSDALVWVMHSPDVMSVAALLTGAAESCFYFPPGTMLALNVAMPQPAGRSMLIFAMPPEYLDS